MSKYRNRQAWLDLFSRWESSGLRAVDFCRREGVCSKYFSVRQRQLGWRQGRPVIPVSAGSAFVPLRVETPALQPPPAALILRRGDCELHLPASLPEAQLRCILREVFCHAVV